MTDSSSNAVAKIFEFDEDTQIRVLGTHDAPLFVLSDIARALGHTNAAVLAKRLDPEGVSQAYTPTNGGPQLVTVVTEAGLYEAVLRSDKPEAVPFRRWVTGTVLPEIRRTGSYGAQPALQGPELLAAAVLESQRLLEQRDARILQLNEKIAADAPKVGYIDTYVADADLLSFSTVASTCEVTEKRLRELLIAKDWIYVQSETRWSESKGKKVERNRYTEKASKKRYFRRVEVHEAPRFRGEVMHTLKVTPAGAEAIARLVAKELAA